MKNLRRQKLSSISAVFPAYNDALTIGTIVEKMIRLLPQVAYDHEVIVVNDGSSDATKEALTKLQKKYTKLHVVTHHTNQGYGATLIDGFLHAKKEYIFYTDGDGQYDVDELVLLVQHMSPRIDMVTGYKLQRNDSLIRKVIGAFYNQTVKFLFQLRTKDTDCDFRLFRRSLNKNMQRTIMSGGFDVQFLHFLHRQKARIKEVGVHHYDRPYGSSQFFTFGRIFSSIKDVIWLRLTVR